MHGSGQDSGEASGRNSRSHVRDLLSRAFRPPGDGAGSAGGEALASLVSHCCIKATSGAVSGVSSVLSLLPSVAAALATVGSAPYSGLSVADEAACGTVTHAITASRNWVANVPSPYRSGCEISDSAAPVVADRTMRDAASTDIRSWPRPAPSSSRSWSIWYASRTAPLLAATAGDHISL